MNKKKCFTVILSFLLVLVAFCITACTGTPTKKTIQVGQYVTFGHYEQDNDTGNGKEEIEWLVLDVQDGKALLLSRYGLDTKPYNTESVDITWESCTLRTWLNGTFMNNAFTAREQKGIVLTNVDNSAIQGFDFSTVQRTNGNTSEGNNTEDRIFLLSYAEANKYLEVTRENTNMGSRVTPTGYAKQQGARTNDHYRTADGDAAGWWWLRSPGFLYRDAACVCADGAFYYHGVDNSSFCVRPALWVDLETAAPMITLMKKPVQVGQYVQFGHYPQTKAGDDNTPVEWLVVDVRDGKALLLSRYALDSQPYNKTSTDVTWETCSLRMWLNGTFMNKAFSKGEQAAILLTPVDNSASQCCRGWLTYGGYDTEDRIFLLSYTETWTYLSSDSARECLPTKYALAQGAYEAGDSDNCWWWWLRSPGFSQYYAAAVRANGSLNDYAVNRDGGSLRPALWVDLGSGIF